jgi:hypothetical protein
VAALAERLRNQTDSVVYMVAQSHNDAVPGAWRRVAKGKIIQLEAQGIKNERIKLLYGGPRKKEEDDYDQRVTLTYWILPANARPPVREGRREKTPKVAMQIGSYSQYDLKHPESERLIFEGFAEVLKTDARLRVCIIVYAELPDDHEAVRLPNELPDIDRNKLVAKWKADLQDKFGISENRIVILQAGAQEMSYRISMSGLCRRGPLYRIPILQGSQCPKRKANLEWFRPLAFYFGVAVVC